MNHTLLPPYLVTQCLLKDSKSTYPRKILEHLPIDRWAPQHGLRARSTGFALWMSSKAVSLHRTHHHAKGPGMGCTPMLLLQTLHTASKELTKHIFFLTFPLFLNKLLQAKQAGIYNNKWMLTLLDLFTFSLALSQKASCFAFFSFLSLSSCVRDQPDLVTTWIIRAALHFLMFVKSVILSKTDCLSQSQLQLSQSPSKTADHSKVARARSLERFKS